MVFQGCFGLTVWGVHGSRPMRLTSPIRASGFVSLLHMLAGAKVWEDLLV